MNNRIKNRSKLTTILSLICGKTVNSTLLEFGEAIENSKYFIVKSFEQFL